MLPRRRETAAASGVVWTSRCSGDETAAALGCSTMPRVARTAASILASTLWARRVRFTSGMSTLIPVVRTRDFAVGPRASSRSTHAESNTNKNLPSGGIHP